MSNIKKTILTLFIFTLSLFLIWIIRTTPWKSPHEILDDFLYGGSVTRAEDMLIDPLLLNSPKIASLISEKILEKQLPRRRYAIDFLGQIKFKPAIKNLSLILTDPQEECFIREDALKSLYNINPVIGRSLAETLRDPCLAKIRKDALNNTLRYYKRPYWKALLGWHD